MQYTQDNGAVIPMRIHTIVISVQHNEDVTLEDMRKALKEQVIKSVVPAKYLDEHTIYHLQPSGRFVIGGPQVRPGLWTRPWLVIGVADLLQHKDCRRWLCVTQPCLAHDTCSQITLFWACCVSISP